MKYKWLLILWLLVFIPFTVIAQQSDPQAILEYYEDSYEIEITDKDGNPLGDVYYGMELMLGDTIETFNTMAELRLDPNGSIIKLGQNTIFTIESLQRTQTESNNFALLRGKMRAVAARGTGGNYSIRTPSAVCGVRGTDFLQETAPGEKDVAICKNGELEFVNTQTGQSVTLKPGFAADVFADSFEPFSVPTDQLQQMFNQMGFDQLDPTSVPGASEEVAEAPAEEEAEEEEEETPAPSDVPEAPEPTETTGDQQQPTIGPDQKGILDPVFDFLSKYLGMELGSMSVDGKTYGKAVLQPKLNLGKFRMALYLPIIYNTNMFDPTDWYFPKGNNEWSFGTDYWETDKLLFVTDLLQDIALKIRYIEFADQRDPFYFKIGNVQSMNIGHGILMQNYANDHDFPAVRRIGVNLGFDVNFLGLETVVNDLADPQIMGGRFYLRPFAKSFKLAFGLSSIVDISPASALAGDAGTDYGDPMFVTGAFDIDLPIIDTDFLSFILFGDLGALLPYYNNGFVKKDDNGTVLYSVEPGWAISSLYNPDAASFLDKFHNVGFSAGLMGNIFIADYRFDLRYYNGAFNPGFFNTTYDRTRAQSLKTVTEYAGYASAGEYIDGEPTFGIFGELNFNIADKVYFELSYLWPWYIEDNTIKTDDEDTLHAELGIKEGVIPIIGLYGSVSYDRTKFIPTLLNKSGFENLHLFDGNTILKGEFIYPATDFFHLALVVTTNVTYDDEGNIVYTDDGVPKINPSVSVETRLNF